MKEQGVRITELAMDAFQTKALKHTIQLLYFKDERSYPEALATAVLVKNKSGHFMITASHVYLENDPARVVIRNRNDEMARVSGNIIYTKNNESKINESFDIAIVKLDDVSINNFLELKLKFEEFKNIRNFHHDGSMYFVFGYPITRTKVIRNEHRVKIEPYRFITEPLNMSIAEYDQKRNVFLKYERKKIINALSGQKVIGPKLVGMSGSGIWTVNVEGELGFKLHSILIEYRRERSLIIGTRMSSIMKIAQLNNL